MLGKTERSLEELFNDDPERADAMVFGRKPASTAAASWVAAGSWPWGRQSAAPFHSPSRCRAG